MASCVPMAPEASVISLSSFIGIQKNKEIDRVFYREEENIFNGVYRDEHTG